MTRLAVFASGRGSNFAAIADAVRSGEIPNAVIAALICNHPDAPALKLAQARGIKTEVVPSKQFRAMGRFDRDAYERALIEVTRRAGPDFICLAGYLLLLGRAVLAEWPNRILNIHPSLLPSFPGLNAQRQALEYGVKWTGCTVHLVNEDLDAGPILAQSVIEIRIEDTLATLSDRLLALEHPTYVAALARLCREPYRIEGRKIVWGAS